MDAKRYDEGILEGLGDLFSLYGGVRYCHVCGTKIGVLEECCNDEYTGYWEDHWLYT